MSGFPYAVNLRLWRNNMSDKGVFDGFLREIKYKSLENIKDISNFINIDDKAKAVSEFFDSIVELSKRPFKSKKPDDITQASDDDLIADFDHAEANKIQHTRPSNLNISGVKIDDFVDMGYMPGVLSRLKEIALPEKWDLGDETRGPVIKNIILRKYFYHTFARAIDTNQIVVDECRTVVIFNTGLVDAHYQPIYVLLTKNTTGLKQEWKFTDFFVVGSGAGKRILSLFHPDDLPKAPQYTTDTCDLIYDIHKGMPTPDYQHCIVDNIHRWPSIIHEHECQSEWSKIEKKITNNMHDKDKSELFQSLRSYVEENRKVYRQYKSRFDDAIDLAFNKVSWNYKTAIPMYWSVDKRIHLLLPLCLDSEDKVDAALVVNKTEKGYIGETILTLEMAYINARLVCRPECDWLNS